MTLQELFDKAADTNGKTKIFHIAVYIFPRWVAMHGNLWKYSTARLESRGATMKKIVRNQTCKRKRASDNGVDFF